MSRTTSIAAPLLTGICFSICSASANAQVFVRNTADIPAQPGGINRFTENVDFADVDLDGDWDAAFSHGGDFGNLQDRIWINLGGLQAGSLGSFSDQTASRFPSVARDGRDIEFVDIDNDGDFDLYVTNNSTNSNQGSQWLVNQGGVQAGTIGFYADETATRFVNLGVSGPSGSSISPTLLINGSFIGWSADADFADLDNDGDMDLVHSSYGASFGGLVPTLIFRNDGAGAFEEFNPSGHQLAGSDLLAGDPGLWCEGTQLHDTTDTTGAMCDVASSATDIDLADVDGDFDIDLLHGSRDSKPRFFTNRLEEQGGSPSDLAFRDVSNAVFPPNWAVGLGHYDQELGDFDGDNDLDIYGMDWRVTGGPFAFSFNDTKMSNDGNGVFGGAAVVATTTASASESDFGDYDNDGDLDIYIASFFGPDRLYGNDGTGVYTWVPGNATGSGLALSGGTDGALDADWCDVDGDGDYDVFSAQDGTRPVLYWENQTNVADSVAPRVTPSEIIGDQVAGLTGSSDIAVRTHVYDNAPYYTTWYNDTELIVEVEGIEIDTIDARSSGGQVFRAELPSNLVGQVTYRFQSSDKNGNTGVSSDATYTASTGLTHELTYGTGTVGATGNLHEIHTRGLATAGKNLYLSIETNSTPTIYVMAISLASIAPTPITSLGLLNIDPFSIVLQKVGVTNASGVHVRKIPISTTVPSGFSIFAQIFGFDGVGGDTYSSSRGLEIPFH